MSGRRSIPCPALGEDCFDTGCSVSICLIQAGEEKERAQSERERQEERERLIQKQMESVAKDFLAHFKKRQSKENISKFLHAEKLRPKIIAEATRRADGILSAIRNKG